MPSLKGKSKLPEPDVLSWQSMRVFDDDDLALSLSHMFAILTSLDEFLSFVLL